MSETIKIEVEIPKPPMPYLRVEFRPAKDGEIVWQVQGDGTDGWFPWEGDWCVTAKRFVAIVPAVPKSVPGFKAGTWFAFDPPHGWFYSPLQPFANKDDKSFAGWMWSCDGGLYIISRSQLAYDFLRSNLGSLESDWRNSAFQTIEDGN